MNNTKRSVPATFSMITMLLGRPLLGFIETLGCTTAQAEGGWLDKGKEMLNKGKASDATGGAPRVGRISAGIKDALEVGTEKIIIQLSKPDGFNTNSTIHIPLPKDIQCGNGWTTPASAIV